MESYNIKVCPTHGKRYSIFCITCKKPICIKCEGDHKDHSIKFLKNFLKEYDFPEQSEYKNILTHIDTIIPSTEEERALDVLRSGLENNNLDEDARMAYMVLKESGVVKYNRIARKVENCPVFEGVDEMYDIEELRRMGERYIPSKEEIPEILSQLEKGTSILQEREEEAREEIKCIIKRLEYLEDVWRNKDMLREESARVVDGVKGMVEEMLERAPSDILERCMRDIKKMINRDDTVEGIEGDVRSIKSEASVLRERRECLIGMLKYIPVQLRQVELVREELSGTDPSEDGRLALMLLRESVVIYFSEINGYEAFEGVDNIFDIDSVMGQELINVLCGVRISRPVRVSMGFPTHSTHYHVSISHNGIIAICGCNYPKYTIQFTNLLTKQQVNMRTKKDSNIAFYDDKFIMLTWREHLREGEVNEVFKNSNTCTLKNIGNIGVHPFTDTSLVHKRRVLLYKDTNCNPYEYNIDTKRNTKLEIGHKVWSLANMGGIDTNVKSVFRDYDNNYIYSLYSNNRVSEITSIYKGGLSNVFPSLSDTSNLKSAAYREGNYLIYKDKAADVSSPIRFSGNIYPSISVVRVYKDVFLLYDYNTDEWVICRIVVP